MHWAVHVLLESPQVLIGASKGVETGASKPNFSVESLGMKGGSTPGKNLHSPCGTHETVPLREVTGAAQLLGQTLLRLAHTPPEHTFDTQSELAAQGPPRG